jgi:hypothetical protein
MPRMDPAAFMRDVRRVCRPGATLTLEVPNRHDGGHMKTRIDHRWRGWATTPAVGWSWSEVERLVAPYFLIEERRPLGWQASARGRLLSHALVGPLRFFSRGIALTARAT